MNEATRNYHSPKPSKDYPLPPRPSPWSTWSLRAWFAFGWATIALTLGKSLLVAAAASSCAVELAMVVAGWQGMVLPELAFGVFHWVIDNYGVASKPVFGPQIEGFQGHHKLPCTITGRQVANNLHELARAVDFLLFPFVLCFAFFIMMSQQFHSWAHCNKRQLPPIDVALQEPGVLVSRTHHGAHHHLRSTSVNGIWNRILDENRVFEALEMWMYFLVWVRPRWWSEPVIHRRMEEGDVLLFRLDLVITLSAANTVIHRRMKRDVHE